MCRRRSQHRRAQHKRRHQQLPRLAVHVHVPAMLGKTDASGQLRRQQRRRRQQQAQLQQADLRLRSHGTGTPPWGLGLASGQMMSTHSLLNASKA